MASVLLLVDRLDLNDALAARGLAIAAPGDHFDAIVASAIDGRAPCLVLARNEATAAALLDADADDVFLDIASPALIAARVAALVRRSASVLRLGDLAIDTSARRAIRAGRDIGLLPREYALLLHLARKPDMTVGRATLREAVWGLDFDPGTNVIEVHVSRLRAKLDSGFAGPMLLTDKGRGYRLVASPAIAPAIAGIAAAL